MVQCIQQGNEKDHKERNDDGADAGRAGQPCRQGAQADRRRLRATALHAAAYAGRTEAARLLIEYKIDIDKQGPNNGYTALHDAIWQNNVETARVIIEGGARLDLQSHAGETPLDFARSKGRAQIVALIEQAIGR
jgi:ankyrin repeat protein